MKSHYFRSIFSFILAILLLFGSAPACFALAVSNNPLVDPKGPVPFVETEDEFFNILIMGVDHGFKGYWGSGGKRKFENCHSDQNIVVSINLTKKQLNLISVPRDSITYIPGKQGIYKLNATFSCADTVEEGIQNVSNAVSWYLGGIQIDCYCVVNMETMVALGDAMGGIDFNVDMNYTGCSGTKYKNGMQHLDGLGIMEYVRARKNATVDGTDIGRTRRGRSMMIAIFKKLYQQPELVYELFKVIEDERYTFVTNVSMDQFLQKILPTFLSLDPDNIGSYILEGSYRTALVEKNFHFIRQNERKQLLKKVFGIDAEEIPYISHLYTQWLVDKGLTTVRYIHVARSLIEIFEQTENPTPEQEKALAEFIAAHDTCVNSFDAAADAQESKTDKKMLSDRKALREVGERAIAAFHYTEPVKWSSTTIWYEDPMINAWQPNWN
ncbi:MAG: LCP family protein [Clostridia bacterium]|nr:LCP family protein [Clostridia bacterium]